MKKISSLYLRDFDGDPRLVTRLVNQDCDWVIFGQGIATEKFDGTSCMVQNGTLFARFDRKGGKPGPLGWMGCEPAPDPHTGHWPGWVRVLGQPQYRWHREAFAWTLERMSLEDGTYELVGPKINGNPHNVDNHMLLRHGSVVMSSVPSDFEGIRDYLQKHVMEGIVWHHPDGRMAKIKAKDFGLQWPREFRLEL